MLIFPIFDCAGGFYGSTDPNGTNLKKKVSMLQEEGVELKGVEPSTADGSVKNVKVSPVSFFDFEEKNAK